MSIAVELGQFSPREYAAFLFDCDGTLVDSAPAHLRAMRAALRQHAIQLEVSQASFDRLSGLSTEEMYRRLASEQSVDLGDIRLLMASAKGAFQNELPSLKPIPEVVAFAEAQAKTSPLAVVSGSSRDSVESILTSLHIMDLFQTIVTPGGTLLPKPEPDIYLEAAHRLAVAAEQCLVFEDSELGFRGAQAAGMDYVKIRPLS